MTRSKLSDLEKQEIVSCFEQQQDTILGLAERYQVSSSTIRRLLKQTASEPSAAQATVIENSVAVPSPLPEVVVESVTPEKIIVLDKKPKLILKPG